MNEFIVKKNESLLKEAGYSSSDEKVKKLQKKVTNQVYSEKTFAELCRQKVLNKNLLINPEEDNAKIG